MNRANPQVKVGFFWKASKERYFLKWKDPDPLSHKYLTRQTDITTRGVRAERQVAKLAEALQAELAERMRRPDGDMLWEEFCRRYKRDHLEATSEANRYKWAAARKIFEKVAAREMLGVCECRDVTPEAAGRCRVAGPRPMWRLARYRILHGDAAFSGLNWAASH
jgi:hypothetical protein